MFKSISFAVFAVAIGSAHAANFDKEESTMATLSKSMLMNDKIAFESSFTSELTAVPADLVYGGTEKSKDSENFEAFNKSSIAKELYTQ